MIYYTDKARETAQENIKRLVKVKISFLKMIIFDFVFHFLKRKPWKIVKNLILFF